MQAVILAAGKGLRLRPFTEKHPKPLININGKALLEHTLASLPDSITEIVIVIGYLGEQIQNHFGDFTVNSNGHRVPIVYVTQTELLGTGDALLRAKTILHDNFLVINGDDLYSKKDLEKLTQTPNSMLVWASQQTSNYGIIKDEQHKFIGFSDSSTLINSGAYFLNCKFFNFPLVSVPVPNGMEYSLPHTLATITGTMPVTLVEATRWLPIGTPQQLKFADEYFTKRDI